MKIFFQHFPLYRLNDMACNEPDSAPLKEKELLFREGWDCLRKDSTEKVIISIYFITLIFYISLNDV